MVISQDPAPRAVETARRRKFRGNVAAMLGEHAPDRSDPEPSAMLRNEAHRSMVSRVALPREEIRFRLQEFDGSSSSRFLRLSFRFSRVISVGIPSRTPASTSNRLIHRRNVSGATPSRLATTTTQTVPLP